MRLTRKRRKRVNKYSKWLEDRIVHYPYVDKWTAAHMLIPACVASMLQSLPYYWFLALMFIFVGYGFYKKWFGVLVSGVIWAAGAGITYLLDYHYSPLTIILIVFTGALLWELYEWFAETSEEYGGIGFRIFNTISDVVVAMIMVGLVVL